MHHVLAAVIVVIIMFTFSHIAWTPEDVGICRDPWISPTFRSQSRAHRGLGICCLSLTHRFRVSQSLDLCFPAVPPVQDISSRSQNIPNFKAWEHQFFPAMISYPCEVLCDGESLNHTTSGRQKKGSYARNFSLEEISPLLTPI